MRIRDLGISIFFNKKAKRNSVFSLSLISLVVIPHVVLFLNVSRF